MKIRSSTSQNAAGAARAFTLIEVMVASGIIGIMMAVIYPAFVQGFASIKTTREDERATQIVTQKIEGFRLLRYSAQVSCPATFLDYYNPAGLATGTQGAVYAGTITIATNGSAALNAVIPSSVSYQNRIRLVTIGVTWTNTVNGTPIPHTRQMQTLSAFYGLQNYLYGNTGP